MRPLNKNSFLILFTILVFIETIIANMEGFKNLHFISKPLIVGALLFYFIKSSKHLSGFIRRFTVSALAFSLLGDVLLLFSNRSSYFFVAGLLAFLVAHILYSLVFLKARNPQRKPYVFIALLLVFALFLFSILKPGLGDLLIPVLLYMGVILVMATSAFLRRGMVSTKNYNLVFLGALFFLISDSSLAINKFYMPFEYADFIIMFTYAAAQLLLVLGLLEARNE